MILVMIIMALIAASGFIVLGLSFVRHKLQLEQKREAVTVLAPVTLDPNPLARLPRPAGLLPRQLRRAATAQKEIVPLVRRRH
jgi:hypothetical protein